MPHLNEVKQIGRLTREVDFRTTANGTKLAKFGLANNERKKNAAGQWEDGPPMFVDVTCFGWLAEHAQANFRKGQEICIHGRLQLEQWEDKNGGGKRSKISIIADTAFGVDWPKKPGGTSPPASNAGDYSGPVEDAPAYVPPADSEIPFAFLLAMLASAVSVFA